MRLVRAFATVGSSTLASRVLGFVRETLIAAALGAGPVADAFYAAFRFPNLFRRLFAEGAFNSAFVPLFARALEQDGEDGARRFAEDVLSCLLFVLLILTALIELAAPLFVATLVAPGFVDDPDKFDLTVLLTRIMFPYLLFMSLVAMLSGALNALHRYFLAAFAPILLNVIMIAVIAFGLLTDLGSRHIGAIMAVGVFLAGTAQLGLLVYGIRREGFGLRLRRPRLTPAVRRLLVLAFPAAIAGGITQINLFVGQIIASQQDGAIAILQFADRVYQLPLGVVGIAIGVVLLPELSRALKAGHMVESAHLQNRSLEFALFLTVPAAAALAVIAEPVVRVLYERGAFVPETTEITAGALAVFALGLPAFVLVKVFSPGFFAREDTRTPMQVAAVTMAVNIALSLALFPRLGVFGIAWATTVAGWVNATALGALLVRRGHWQIDAVETRRSLLIFASALAMGGLLYVLYGALGDWFRPDTGLLHQLAALLALVGLGAGSYFLLAHLSGAMRLGRLVGYLSRRKPPVADDPA